MDPGLAVEQHLETLLGAVDPASRRALMREIAIGLRRRNQQRIKDQKNPDGTDWAPRKARARGPMFKKLRTARFLRVQHAAGKAIVGFRGRQSMIAKVHQQGRLDRVTQGGPYHRYAERRLLGITPADAQWITDRILDHLAAG